MTLDEAIKHAEEMVEENERICQAIPEHSASAFHCAEEHRQLAEWLKELKRLKEQTEWVPVSKKLPEAFSLVNCTCHSLIDDREDWVIETCYVPLPQNSPYSDWGNIPMLNSCECEVVAWMYRDIPKPYKAEREEARKKNEH